jgi:dihydrofolate synthase/folylpolyglutamate synthase
VLTVGGTNGKGSVCAYLESILLRAGFRTGLYTSPHLLRYNERVRINGGEIDDESLLRAFERIERARGEVSLTYFEFGTLAAALIFNQSRLDVAILEVGLGGRLDAVNLFDADCAAVISVDLDHMNLLGPTRESIGFEKAGIFRSARPAVCADPDPPASLLAHARSIGAHLRRIGIDFGYEAQGQHWRYFGPAGKRNALPHPALRGAHQLGNAAAAIAVLDELKSKLPVSMQALRMGLASASLPGRFQVLPGRPAVVLDVAHNPHAARALVRCLQAHRGFRRTIAVFAMLADKDIAAVAETVKTRIDRWYVASLPGPRGSSAQSLAKLIERVDPGKPLRRFASLADAYHGAVESAAENDRILVFGSFHTVSEVLAIRTRRNAHAP